MFSFAGLSYISECWRWEWPPFCLLHGDFARNAAGSKFRLRSGFPHRAMGKPAVLCSSMSLQGGIGAAASPLSLSEAVSLKPLLAARILHLPLSLSIFALSLPQKRRRPF